MALQAQAQSITLKPELATALLTALRPTAPTNGATGTNGAASATRAAIQVTSAGTQLLAPGEFQRHMTAMRAYYRTGPALAYPLPLSIMHPIGIRRPPIILQPFNPLNQTNQELRTNLTNWTYAQQTATNAATANLQNTGDQNSFQQQMEGIRTSGQQSIDDSWNKHIDDLEAAAANDPSLQNQYLQNAQQSGNFVSSLLNSVSEFFTGLIAKVVAWVQAAAQWLAQAAQAAADWVAGAVGSIGDFFGGLF